MPVVPKDEGPGFEANVNELPEMLTADKAMRFDRGYAL